MRNVQKRAIKNSGHGGVRRGHQVHRDHLGVGIAAELLAGLADPEFGRDDP